jgi:hypothetical protein
MLVVGGKSLQHRGAYGSFADRPMDVATPATGQLACTSSSDLLTASGMPIRMCILARLWFLFLLEDGRGGFHAARQFEMELVLGQVSCSRQVHAFATSQWQRWLLV